ncbi:MAG: hypothetical protein HRT68_05550 [Flavobacteriaceae bacterium]|nr:hypothetical protein [Flavobacteriaceae bacterium]
MKKLLLLFVCIVVFSSCSNDDDSSSGISCPQAAQDAADAIAAFTADPTTENCITVRNALEAQRDSCGDPTGSIAAQLAALTQC